VDRKGGKAEQGGGKDLFSAMKEEVIGGMFLFRKKGLYINTLGGTLCWKKDLISNKLEKKRKIPASGGEKATQVGRGREKVKNRGGSTNSAKQLPNNEESQAGLDGKFTEQFLKNRKGMPKKGRALSLFEVPWVGNTLNNNNDSNREERKHKAFPPGINRREKDLEKKMWVRLSLRTLETNYRERELCAKASGGIHNL